MIKYFSYKYIPYILLISLMFSSDYNNLFLMEFENSSRDPRTDYLRYGLPEIVRLKYAQHSDINIEYAPKSTSIHDDVISKLNDGILLYGNFNTINNNVVISFNVFDVDTWDEKSNRSFKCGIDDLDCIENAFYICVEEDVMSHFCDYFDCLGECEGAAKEDCMGVCQGNAYVDCNNLCNGINVLDECGNCDSDPGNDCTKDCHGDWGGSAYFNECEVCVTGNTGKAYDYGLDCKGVCWGEDKIDCNGVCGGESRKDCNGDCDGEAYLNRCSVCVDGNTENDKEQGIDCNGQCFGDAVIDECGVCDGFNKSCSDCMGVPFGNAKVDNCGKCDTNPLDDCTKDCNDIWGGSAFINDCLICVSGNTNIKNSEGMDCNGECWGNSKLDECGVCNGPGAIFECGCHDVLPGTCDCAGNVLDLCDVCGGDGRDDDDDGICDHVDDFIGVKENNNSSTQLDNQVINDAVNIELFTQKEESDDVVNLFNNYKNNDRDENTKLLYQVFDQELLNIYKVVIDKKNVNHYYHDNLVDVTIPVNYSINYRMFLQLFENFSYNVNENANGTNTIQFNKNDFNIMQEFEEYCALMKYQLVPVLFFTDELNDIKHIHVDSWYNYNLKHISNDIDISYSYDFSTMFSVSTSADYLYFNFDLNEMNHDYNFSFPKRDIHNYAKLYIKFFFANNLESNLLSYAIK